MSEHDRPKNFFPSMGRPSYAQPDPPKPAKLGPPMPPGRPLTRAERSPLVPDAMNRKTGKKRDKGGPEADVSEKTGIVVSTGRRGIERILKHPRGFFPGEFPKDYRPIIEEGYRKVGKRPPKRTRP